MAILGEIRKRIWILFGLVGLALFAFLFNPDQWSEYFKSDPNLFGKVNDENISKQEFELMNSYVMNQSRGQATNEQVWSSMVQNKLISQKFDQAGMELSDETFWDYAEYSSMFSGDQSLFDEKGNFNSKKLIEAVEKIKEEAKTNPQAEQQYNQFLQQKELAENEIKARLYFGAISKGLLVNKKEVAFAQKIQGENAQFEYVQINYEQYNQKNKTTVTDNDLNEYIKSHPFKFKKGASVDLKYVIFNNKYTAEDDSITLKDVKLYLSGGILKDENGVDFDSVKSFSSISNAEVANYLDEYSDRKFENQYISAIQQPVAIKDWVGSAGIGSVIGPYTDGDLYKISKLIDKKTNDSTATKHILISYKGSGIAQSNPNIKRTKDQAKKLADSLLTAIGGNASKFDTYISKSDDEGSKVQGGNVGWTTPSEPKFVPAFQQFVDQNPKGKIGMVESEFGFHIIQIADKKPGGFTYNVAHFVKERKASDKTTKITDGKSNTFAQNIMGKSEKDFTTIAKKNDYEVMEQNGITRFAGNLNGINPQTDTSNEIITWAYNKDRKVGDSELFSNQNKDNFVVTISAKNPAGLATAAMARTEIEMLVRNKKIAKIISEKINSSKKSLDAIAAQFASTKQIGTISFLNPFLAGANEAKVAGAVFGIKPNVVSKPIEGSTGIYVVTTKSITKNPAPTDVKQVKQSIKQQTQQGLSIIISSLENNSTIKDLRIEATQ